MTMTMANIGVEKAVKNTQNIAQSADLNGHKIKTPNESQKQQMLNVQIENDLNLKNNMSSSLSLNDDNLDFDEKMDQGSYMDYQKNNIKREVVVTDGYEDPNDSDFDDGGFMSDEVDEKRGLTPQRLN